MAGTPGDLDAETDATFQRAEWRVQRWGLSGLVVLATASMLGYVGSPATFFRVVAIYGFLLIVFRLSGKRTLAQMTSFDLVLVLDEIDFVVLERSGGLSIIAKQHAG